MIRWIRRIAFGMGIFSFFALLFVGTAAAGKFSWNALFPVIVRAMAGGGLLWLAGVIIADMLVKGIVADLPEGDGKLPDEGLLRRIYTEKDRTAPPQPDAPGKGAQETAADIRQ